MMEQKKYNQIDKNARYSKYDSELSNWRYRLRAIPASRHLPISCPRSLLQKQDLQAVARQADGIVLDEQWLCSR